MLASASRLSLPATQSWLPRWLPVSALLLALFAVASLTWTQFPTELKAADATASEAIALDQKLLTAAKKDSELMANLTYLSDMIGPRVTGSAAVKRANEWAADKMKSYGLVNVNLEGWSIPVGWERGTATARIIEPDNGCTLSFAALGWTPGTKGKIEADVVVMTAKNSKELAAYKGKLKGAVVLRGPPANVRPITDLGLSPPGRGGQTPEDGKPAEKKPEPDKKPEQGSEKPPEKKPVTEPSKAEQAAFRRELADFLYSEGTAVLLHDAAKPHGLLTTTGGWRSTDRVDAPEPLPSAFMAHEHYALLYRLATRPEPREPASRSRSTTRSSPAPSPSTTRWAKSRGARSPTSS